MAIHAYAGPIEPRSMDICVAVAREQLDLFVLDVKTLADRCECVGQKHNGKLPLSKVTWSKSGKSNFALDLVDCAEVDIVTFYSDATFKAANGRLKEKGLSDADITRFSTCVGNGAFNEVRRVVFSTRSAKLDKARFREMYRNCEAAKN